MIKEAFLALANYPKQEAIAGLRACNAMIFPEEGAAERLDVGFRGVALDQERHKRADYVDANRDRAPRRYEKIKLMYADPQAVKFYAQKIGKPESLVELSRRQFHPKEALDPDRLSDIDGVMADAVALKFLDAPLTKEQLAEFLQIPARN